MSEGYFRLVFNKWAMGTLDPKQTSISTNPHQFFAYHSERYLGGLKTYYGDEINLAFWSMLGLEIGTPDGQPVFTRNNGYLYKYYVPSKTALYYDNQGILIYQNTNIQTIADLHIDFTIHKSHQFEIYIMEAYGIKPWYMSATAIKKTYASTVKSEFHEIIDEHSTASNTNLGLNQFALINARNKLYYNTSIKYNRKYYRTPSLVGLLPSGMQIYNRPNGFAAQVYVDDFVPFNVVKVPKKFPAKLSMPKMVLSMLSNSLYPRLQPVLREDETQNNRPIYEPWLIVMLKFIFKHPFPPRDDEWPVDTLDLGVNWSY